MTSSKTSTSTGWCSPSRTNDSGTKARRAATAPLSSTSSLRSSELSPSRLPASISARLTSYVATPSSSQDPRRPRGSSDRSSGQARRPGGSTNSSMMSLPVSGIPTTGIRGARACLTAVIGVGSTRAGRRLQEVSRRPSVRSRSLQPRLSSTLLRTMPANRSASSLAQAPASLQRSRRGCAG